MDELAKKILAIAGYLFAGLLLVFTSIQTYAFLYAVSKSHLTAAIGLILFEASMLYWWQVFRREAHGIAQLAISAIMFGLGLVLVTTAVSLHLGAISAEFLGTETPARIMVIAAILNLVAKLIFPLVHPDTFDQVTDRAAEGKIIAKAQKLFNGKIDGIAEALADEMAELRTETARAKIYENFTTALNRRGPKRLTTPAELDIIPLATPNPNGTHPTD